MMGGSKSLKNNYVLEQETLGLLTYEKNQSTESMVYYFFPHYCPNSNHYFDSSTTYNGEMITDFFHVPSPSRLSVSNGDYGLDLKPPLSLLCHLAWDFFYFFYES